MKYQQALMQRAGSQCELCGSTYGLTAYEIPASPKSNLDSHILLCENCRE